MHDYVLLPDNEFPNTGNDNGGVHIFSGIPNRAFCLLAISLGGYSWERAGQIWYKALLDPSLRKFASQQENWNKCFQFFADLTYKHAKEYGSEVEAQVEEAWVEVGIELTDRRRKESASEEWSMKWEIGEYLRQEFALGEELSDILVICCGAGAQDSAKCMTCKDLLDSEGSQRLSQAFLFLVGSAFSPTSSGTEKIFVEPSQDCWVEMQIQVPNDHSDITVFSAETNSRELLKTVEKLLLSLSAALRPSLFTAPSISEAKLTDTDGKKHISLVPLSRIPKVSCWFPLFPGKVVVRDEAQGSRDVDMHGLELPFGLMTEICGIDVPVRVDGGLCLLGVFTLLVPIAVGGDTLDCMQWHLFSVPDVDDVSQARNNLWELWQTWLERGLHGDRQKWYKTNELNDLIRRKRHFLGWCRKSVITLGTQTQTYTLTRSSAPEKPKEVVETATAVGANFTFHGAGIPITRTFKRGRTERNPFEKRDRNLGSWLLQSQSQQVLLYCPSRKQAWLVPTISTVLHLALAYLVECQSRDPTFRYNLPYCRESSATGLHAYRTVIAHLQNAIPLVDIDDKPYKFKNIIIEFLYMLDAISRKTRSGWIRQKFYGFEARDLVEQPRYFKLKKGSASVDKIFSYSLGGWVRLLEEIPVVLFFEGIDDPIKPVKIRAEPGRWAPCTHWCQMPTDQNYLAATTESLKELSAKYPATEWGRLANTAYWHRAAFLFEHCRCNPGGRRCDRLQAIWNSRYAQSPQWTDIQGYPEGAVIFDCAS